jgi:hypothetical protein
MSRNCHLSQIWMRFHTWFSPTLIVKSSVESLRKDWYTLDIHIPKAIIKRSKGQVLSIQCTTRHHWILCSGMISSVMIPCCPCTVVWKLGHKTLLSPLTYFAWFTWWNSHHACEMCIWRCLILAWHTGVGSIEVLRSTLKFHYALPLWRIHKMTLT